MKQELIDALAAARHATALADVERIKLVEAFEATPEYKAAMDALRNAKAEEARLDAEVRAEALAEYKANGTKNPHEKVSIAIFTIVPAYNEAAAREWCFTNFRPALKLDTKTFEKAVTDGQIPDTIAQSDTEARVRIAKQL